MCTTVLMISLVQPCVNFLIIFKSECVAFGTSVNSKLDKLVLHKAFDSPFVISFCARHLRSVDV